MSRTSRFSDQTRANIVKAYEAGEQLLFIAAKFKLSRSMVNHIVRKSGCARRHDRKRHAHRKIRPDRIKAARLFESGKTFGQIARELGITRNAVAGAVRDVRLAQSTA